MGKRFQVVRNTSDKTMDYIFDIYFNGIPLLRGESFNRDELESLHVELIRVGVAEFQSLLLKGKWLYSEPEEEVIHVVINEEACA